MFDYEDDIDEVCEIFGDFAKGAKMAGKGKKIVLPPRGANRVNIIDMGRGRIGADGVPRGEWMFRLDGPHRGMDGPHINIHPDRFGIPDPHTRITPGQLRAGESAAKIAKKANKVLVPVAIAMDVVQTGISVKHDIDQGTTRNTAETAGSIAGGWGGGLGGAELGAAAGTAIFPGVGTIVGGIVGGIAGGLAGSILAEKVVHEVGDELDYDTENKRCKRCGNKYKYRKYQKDSSSRYCKRCR